jgi:nicotinamide-nucleotide amidase
MESDDLARRVGDSLTTQGWRGAVAESLTGGLLCQALAKTEGSGDWFLGGVVAYHRSVKHGVLGVTAERVVSAPAAEQMAAGVRRLVGADVSVGVTGVAGPTRQDGEPTGTVFTSAVTPAGLWVEHHRFDGSPREVCEQAVQASLRLLLRHLSGEE